MRSAVGEWTRSKLECIGDPVRKGAVVKIGCRMVRISGRLSKLSGSGDVVRRAAMRSEHGQILWSNADSVAHRQQGCLELFGGRYWCWVAELIHGAVFEGGCQ